jgi:hypothetical protein
MADDVTELIKFPLGVAAELQNLTSEGNWRIRHPENKPNISEQIRKDSNLHLLAVDYLEAVSPLGAFIMGIRFTGWLKPNGIPSAHWKMFIG